MAHTSPRNCVDNCCDEPCTETTVSCPRRKDETLGYVLDWTVSDNSDSAWIIKTCYGYGGPFETRIDLDLGAGFTGTIATDLYCSYRLYAENECGQTSRLCVLPCEEIDTDDVPECQCLDQDTGAIRSPSVTIVLTVSGSTRTGTVILDGAFRTIPAVDISGSYSYDITWFIDYSGCTNVYTPSRLVMHYEYRYTDGLGRDIYYLIYLDPSLFPTLVAGFGYLDGGSWVMKWAESLNLQSGVVDPCPGKPFCPTISPYLIASESSLFRDVSIEGRDYVA
jgi:hypothetical protein